MPRNSAPFSVAISDCLDGSETCLDEEFQLALIAEAGQGVPVACGVRTGEEGSASRDESALEVHLLAEQLSDLKLGDVGGPFACRAPRPPAHGLPDAVGIGGRWVAEFGLEDRERRGDGHVPFDQMADEGLDGCRAHLELEVVLLEVPERRTFIRPLPREEFRVREEPMLQVVDS